MRSKTTFLDLFTARVGALFLFVGAVSVLCTTLLPTVQILALPACAPGTHQVAGRCTPDPQPVALATDTATATATEGTTAEGTTAEVIRLPEGYALETTPMVPVSGTRYVVPEESPDGGHVLPAILWLDNSPVYSGPQSWVLHVDDTQQRVTWRLYVDVVSDVDDPSADESTAVQTVAQVTTTAVPTTLSRTERQAVRLILDRQHSGRPMFEDLTWRGAPRVVGQANDALLERFESTGQRYTTTNLHKWLHRLARTGRA